MPAAARSAPDTIQCFKPGRHLALSGALLAFGEADLAATAAAYDPALHEAPLVVGHPATDAPAYGWVGALGFAGGALEAQPRQVNAEFAALVNAGTYKKVSAAFWTPDAPGNPVPGVYYLRHIGFLGGAAPAVKGLRTPSFAAGEAGVVEFAAEFDGWQLENNASLWRALRDWVLAKFGQEDADLALPAYRVAGLERAAQREIEAGTAKPGPVFAAPSPHEETAVTPEEKAALEAENAALRQQLAERSAAERARRDAAALADAEAFAEGLVAAGRLPDGERALVVDVLARIGRGEGEEGAAIAFGEGTARAPVLPALKTLLQALPVRAAQGSLATAAAAAGEGAAEGPAFAAPAGFRVDPAKAALHARVVAHRAAHPSMSYEQALAACMTTNA